MQRVVAIPFDGLHGHTLTVVANADETHLALTLGHLHGIVQALLVARTRTIRWIVELVQIKIVGLEVLQRGVQVSPKILDGGGTRLGGDEHLAATVGEGCTDLLLAVGVEPRCVVEVDAVVVSLMEQVHGFFLADPLDGKGTKAVLVHLQVGLP